MTLVTGVLTLRDAAPQSGFLLTNVDVVGSTPTQSIFQIVEPLDAQRWTGIVIHHSSNPAGDAEALHRSHRAAGLDGLGYHFVIGNGNGLGDGVIQVGYRWDHQLPGAHVAGAAGVQHNARSIAICLIGDGDRRAFTERQMAQLVNLTHALQGQLRIPARSVRMHRDLFQLTSSPGHFFPAARFQEQLLD